MERKRDQLFDESETLKCSSETAVLTPAVRRGGVERSRRGTHTSKNLLVSGSVVRTTEMSWFHGMWTARNQVALSRVSWSTELLLYYLGYFKILKRILKHKEEDDNGLLQSSGQLPMKEK